MSLRVPKGGIPKGEGLPGSVELNTGRESTLWKCQNGQKIAELKWGMLQGPLRVSPIEYAPGTLYNMGEMRCDWLTHTDASPFVVFILYKTSGRFLGMGSIIDRKTVLTAEETIPQIFKEYSALLVLAGCRSPWWTKNTQVRHVKSASVNEYEIVLLEMEQEWNFVKNVRPVRLMKKLVKDLEPTYGKELGVFGVSVPSYFGIGDILPKGVTYYFSEQSCSKENDCGKHYLDLRPFFNDSIHSCLFSNGSYCSGCVGSPVVGLTKDSRIELVGVIVRSSCILYINQELKIPCFSLTLNACPLVFFILGHFFALAPRLKAKGVWQVEVEEVPARQALPIHFSGFHKMDVPQLLTKRYFAVGVLSASQKSSLRQVSANVKESAGGQFHLLERCRPLQGTTKARTCADPTPISFSLPSFVRAGFPGTLPVEGQIGVSRRPPSSNDEILPVDATLHSVLRSEDRK